MGFLGRMGRLKVFRRPLGLTNDVETGFLKPILLLFGQGVV
ncbi:hypothetical protein [Neisseria sicca]|nr:hypothetical protein [Neisseria sicca]